MIAFGQYDTIPESGVISVREGKSLMIFFDFEKFQPTVEEGREEYPDNYYKFQSVTMYGQSTYGAIVSAIINDRYTLDDVQAIIANYEDAKEQSEPSDKDKEHISEYEEYQAFRKHAKEVAKLIV